MRKKVSVITGTYNRPTELRNCIKYVQNQTYKNIEHCIVHDGPASQEVKTTLQEAMFPNNGVTYQWQETGRQWSHFLASSISAVPYQVAQWLASGDYIMWLADDEEITEDHIESLVDLLEKEDVDFVYSQTEIWFSPALRHTLLPRVIGSPLPKNGNITQALFRVELLDYRGFQTHVGSGTDIDQVAHWIAAGASWAYLERPTHTHRVDKFGDTEQHKVRQLLRGDLQPVNPRDGYIGFRFNDLTITQILQKGDVVVRCVCMDNNTVRVSLAELLKGTILNCGGLAHEASSNSS